MAQQFAVTAIVLVAAGCALGVDDDAPVDPATDPYQIALHYQVPPSAELRLVVEQAAARWESLILVGLPDRSSVPHECGPTAGGYVDDLSIEIRVTEMDGPGGTLAVAGPTCIRRSAGFLPVTGRLTLDSVDVERLLEVGNLEAVVLHEIGHVLGIGTGWRDLSLLDAPSCAERCVSGGDVRYRGEGARRAWLALGGTGGVPVENRLGPGSQDSHWREASMLRGELMSPILSRSNPLSQVTVGALSDLGYQVDGGDLAIPAGTYGTLDPSGTVALHHDVLDEAPLVIP